MPETKISHPKRIYTSGIASMLVVLLALFLFKVEDPYKIGLLLVAGALWVLRPLPFREWSLLDGCVAALTLFDLCSCFYAACPIPAMNAAFYSVYMLTVYFVCRRLFAHERALQIFRVGSLFPIGAALLLAVCSFLVFRRSVLEAGFEDTYHFRFLFSPLGYITNIWAEVLLMLSGWISLMRSACFTTACDTRRLCPLRLFGLYIGRHVTGHRISAISGSCATQSGNSLAVVGRYGKIPPASQSGIRPS